MTRVRPVLFASRMSPVAGVCGHPNEAGLRFCTTCGVPLALGCPACGQAVSGGQAFCGHCGAALAPSAAPPSVPPPSGAPEGERKQVTVLFADVVGSMELAEQLGADEWTQVVQGLFAVCREAVEEFGGTVDKFTGDGVMALFGAPVAQEDHARRSAHAALRLVERATNYASDLPGVELAVRVGLNSGDVVAGPVGEAFTAIGHTVGLAQRMESLAEPGAVRVSEHTVALLGAEFRLRDLGSTAVKGSSAPVRVHALDGVVGGSSAAARRRSGSARLVGRGEELAALTAALVAAQRGNASVIGIVGEAGAGKSRLCEELARRAAELEVTVRRTAGVSHAQTAPLLPILGLLRDYFGVADGDSAAEVRAKAATALLRLDPELADQLPLIYDFLEVPDPERPAPQLTPEVRRARVLEVFRQVTVRRSEQQTLLLILEDLHWFDPHSVAFLDAWLPNFPGTRTLVVTNFRPEFHAPWMGSSSYRQIPLVPLDGPAVQELLDELLGPDPSLGELVAQLRTRSGGNPFFVEEIVRALAADGTLTGGPGNYRLAKPIASVTVPATVHGVLTGRIDRLAAPEKAVLQAAAVIGRIFSAPVLAAVATDVSPLGPVLDALCARELIQRTETAGEYRFWHPLTQEVAHSTLLAARRRRLHAEVARALVTQGPDRHDEIATVVATHFEEAGDDLEAARWQLRAGLRASLADVTEGIRRLRACVEHLDAVEEETETLRIFIRAAANLARLMGRAGSDLVDIQRVVTRVQESAQRLGDPGQLAYVTVSQIGTHFFAGEVNLALRLAEEARRFAEQAGDDAVLAFALLGETLACAYTEPAAGLVAARELREVCSGKPLLGIPVVGYSVHDAAAVSAATVLYECGRLGAARRVIDEGLEHLARRPAAEWQSWLLATKTLLLDRTGDPAEIDTAGQWARESLRLSQDSGNIPGILRARHAMGVLALLTGRASEARTTLTDVLAQARERQRGLQDETHMLWALARAQLATGDVRAARSAADEALATAERQQAPVAQCVARLIEARIWREGGAVGGDLPRARHAAEAGLARATDIGALTLAAFLAEERALLEEDSTSRRAALKACADGYDAIGATGHARRLREELA